MSDKISRVFLTGFSGTGKSTVAKLVAKKLGWVALDTDDMIAESAGKSPADILSSDGEERFRELEREAIREAASRNQVVVATGGGAVIAKANRLEHLIHLTLCKGIAIVDGIAEWSPL